MHKFINGNQLTTNVCMQIKLSGVESDLTKLLLPGLSSVELNPEGEVC